MRIRVLAGLVAMLFATGAPADSIDINFSDDSVQAAYTGTAKTAEYEIRFLDNDDRDNWLVSAGLLAAGPRMETEVGLGGKLYLMSAADEDIYGLALGGQVRLFPGNGPIGIGGSLFYAPDVLTGGDGEGFWEGTLRLEFEVIPDTASLYVGYRKVRAELENGVDVTVDKGGHIGLQISF